MTLYRFDQIAENIRVPVIPSDTDLDRYVGLEHLDPEALKLRRWGNPSEVIGQKLRFWEGDIIYGKRRAYQRKLAVADFDGICSAHAFVLRAKPDVCLPEFLPFFLQSELFHQRALEISVGSLSPTINWSTLAKQEFPLPPVDEQRRIADLLWAADDTIETHKTLLDSLSTAYNSLVHQKFSGNYVKEENPIALSKVCDVLVGFPFKSKLYKETGVRLLRCSNVGIHGCEWAQEETKYWDESEYENFKIYHLQKDDIVIAMDRPFVGDGFKVSKVTDDDLPSLLLQRVARLRPFGELCLDYLWAFLQAKAYQNHLQKNQQGTQLPHISKFDIESAIIPLRSKDEQKALSEEFRSFAVAIEQAKIHLANLFELKKQLLAKYLTG
jgi:type I restriction enzyme, S subunit